MGQIFTHCPAMVNFDISLFCCALGLAFAMEGALWAAFPEGMRRAMTEMAHAPSFLLRACGLAALALGLGLVALGRL
ncbi:MAG: DUF2065 domain-containing protein [Desulfovibrionaceae bacterium]|nr:DUF2065 domain-containing protein [Desulfovibrionaceae bacterium]